MPPMPTMTLYFSGGPLDGGHHTLDEAIQMSVLYPGYSLREQRASGDGISADAVWIGGDVEERNLETIQQERLSATVPQPEHPLHLKQPADEGASVSETEHVAVLSSEAPTAPLPTAQEGPQAPVRPEAPQAPETP